MELIERIAAIIEPSLSARGYEAVRIKITGGKKTVVAVEVDRLDDAPVGTDDCAKAGHLISAVLDVEDLIEGPYNLEVSSPGETRPLKKLGDFERFCGKEAEIETSAPVNGRQKFRGKLLRTEQNIDDAVVYLREECDTGAAEFGVPYGGIKRASVKRF
ncbi:MAG: ribosome maturation factor RimP [Holosporaceae bacterium]|nr:ribosome maturation factor RimP [Holosporaceae bacterium]